MPSSIGTFSVNNLYLLGISEDNDVILIPLTDRLAAIEARNFYKPICE
jgi:hypothetical protein